MKWLFLLNLTLLGCQPSLNRQPKNTALSESGFFADGAAARMLPPGAVPFRTGQEAPAAVLDATTLKRGQLLYGIHCTICHGPVGDGDSVAVARGFPAIPSLLLEKTRAKSDADLLNVLENGDGKMYGFGERVPEEDLQAVVFYLRALQLSQNQPLKSLSAADQALVKEEKR